MFLQTGFRTFSAILFLRVSDIARECSHTEAWIRSRLCLSEPRPTLSVLDRRVSQMLYAKKKKKKEKRVILPSWFRDRYVRVRGHESLLAGEKEWRFNKQVDGICLREITVLVAKEQRQVSLT